MNKTENDEQYFLLLKMLTLGGCIGSLNFNISNFTIYTKDGITK